MELLTDQRGGDASEPVFSRSPDAASGQMSHAKDSGAGAASGASAPPRNPPGGMHVEVRAPRIHHGVERSPNLV
jgi:hypothetical protein